MIAPGATIGILGAGQLGRMLAMTAARLGYRAHIYAPETGPANDVAAAYTRGNFEDVHALAHFAERCAVVTYEFENVPFAPLAGLTNVRPGCRALEVAQDRLTEKRFMAALGGRTAPFAAVDSLDNLHKALEELGTHAILKTRRFGYDGKGQAFLRDAADAAAAWGMIGREPAILEGLVTFSHEFSIVLARGVDGAMVSYPPPWNEHRDGILRRSTLPAPPEIARHWTEAAALTGRIADALDYVGVLTCEFFASDNGPVVNEIAPRVHNSGHWTIEGAVTSQFENHLRAICGLPLGDTALTHAGVVMDNLIGADAGDWAVHLAATDSHLHLYGKHEARPGRKMGHVTRLRTFDPAGTIRA